MFLPLLLLSLVFTVASGTSATAQRLELATVAGTPDAGYDDGVSSVAHFSYPAAGAADVLGRLYIADSQNHVIRVVLPWGEVRTLAGRPGAPGSTDGPAAEAQFNSPQGIAVGASGELYVSDTGNHVIRRIAPDGSVTTLAGAAGQAGWRDEHGDKARFSTPLGIATDVNGYIYVADSINQLIRRVDRDGNVLTLAGAPQRIGFANGYAEAARFQFPTGVAVAPSGDIYVADSGNHAVRRITPGGNVSTAAGDGVRGRRDGGGASARFDFPTSVAVDPSGRVMVADSDSRLIRRIGTNDVVETLTTTAGATSLAALAISGPFSLFTDGIGKLFVVDTHGHSVRTLQLHVSRRRGVRP